MEWLPEGTKKWLNRKVYGFLKIERKRRGKPANNNDNYGVIYVPLSCPACNSEKVKTYCWRPPIIYHRCADCGWKFKSTKIKPQK